MFSYAILDQNFEKIYNSAMARVYFSLIQLHDYLNHLGVDDWSCVAMFAMAVEMDACTTPGDEDITDNIPINHGYFLAGHDCNTKALNGL